MFVLTMPGLALLAARELAAAGGVSVRDSGSDGRSDVLLIDADRAGRGGLRGLRLAEDVFAEVGRTIRADGDTARSVAGRIWRPERSARALSMWAEHRGPLRAAMSFRVVARVLTETSFLRTDLRRELTRVVARDRPRWRPADPADLEVWVAEYAPGRFVCGLRLSDERMRQHGGRPQERRGALRPSAPATSAPWAWPTPPRPRACRTCRSAGSSTCRVTGGSGCGRRCGTWPGSPARAGAWCCSFPRSPSRSCPPGCVRPNASGSGCWAGQQACGPTTVAERGLAP